MNKNEIDKIMILKNEVQELNEKVISLNHFLRNYSNSFVNENSKEALDRIEKFMKKMISERVIKEDKIQKISESIDCNHELVIKSVLETECPMCKRRFKLDKEKNNSKYVISCYYDYAEDEEDINKIIIKAKDEEDAFEDLLEYFGEKQANGNINIRRLVK